MTIHFLPRTSRVMPLLLLPCLLPLGSARASQQPEKPAIMAKDSDPGWEVLTVRPSDPNYKFDYFTVRGQHVIVKNQTVESMVRTAYGLQRSQVVGLPDWAKTEHFDADGLPDKVGEPNAIQVRGLMRNLLAQRFGLKAHHEQREMPVYALTLAKGGPRMEPSKADPNGMPDNVGGNDNGRQARKFTNVSMADLASMLQFNVDRPVIDRTGLAGRYDFKLQWTVDQVDAGAPDAPPGLFTAIQEQIGLKLQPEKANADLLVIDAVDRPTAN
jgi:uncharacterized protein (TIGR03435 family)